MTDHEVTALTMSDAKRHRTPAFAAARGGCRHAGRSRAVCDAARFLRAAEAARDVARRLHGAGRHGDGAGHVSIRSSASPRCSPSRSAPAPPAPQHVVRRRYRRADDPHRQAPDPGGRVPPRRGARLRADPRRSSRCWCSASSSTVLAAALLAFTIFFYAVVYSMWLKRWTPQNIVIGGAAGAFPPMIG